MNAVERASAERRHAPSRPESRVLRSRSQRHQGQRRSVGRYRCPLTLCGCLISVLTRDRSLQRVHIHADLSYAPQAPGAAGEENFPHTRKRTKVTNLHLENGAPLARL